MWECATDCGIPGSQKRAAEVVRDRANTGAGNKPGSSTGAGVTVLTAEPFPAINLHPFPLSPRTPSALLVLHDAPVSASKCHNSVIKAPRKRWKPVTSFLGTPWDRFPFRIQPRGRLEGVGWWWWWSHASSGVSRNNNLRIFLAGKPTMSLLEKFLLSG